MMGQSKREFTAQREAEYEAELLGTHPGLLIRKQKSMNKQERMNALFTKYGLTKDDYFKHKFYTIITRSGIDKIQAKAEIEVSYHLIYHTPDCKTAIVKAAAKMKENQLETFGEVSPANNSNSYPIAMAEKRAMSRAVLKLAGFYAEGAFGEDEADDFKRDGNS